MESAFIIIGRRRKPPRASALGIGGDGLGFRYNFRQFLENQSWQFDRQSVA
jgi:hypothetical protein